jgi:hypothetical protein
MVLPSEWLGFAVFLAAISVCFRRMHKSSAVGSQIYFDS